MSSSRPLPEVPGLQAARLTIHGLAIFCFNRLGEHKFWEVAYPRHEKHDLFIEITETDGAWNPTRKFPPVLINQDLLEFGISLTAGSEEHYDAFPEGGPFGQFDRGSGNTDPYDLQWMIDLTSAEPRHGAFRGLIPRGRRAVNVTLARLSQSFIFTGRLSEHPVRFSPRRNDDPDGEGNFDLGVTNEELFGFLLANGPGEIRFDGLGIAPLPYGEDKRYLIEIINMDNLSGKKKDPFVKGDFHLYYDVIDVAGPQQELWAFPTEVGRFAPDGDCAGTRASLETLQPLIE